MIPRTHYERAVDIDPVTLWGAIVIKRREDKRTIEELCKELGLSPATFTRLRYAGQGIQPKYRPDLPSYMSICWWLNRNPADFVIWPDGNQPGTEPHE